MSNTAKNLVRSFYESELLNDPDVVAKHMHPDVTLFWNSSFGFTTKSYEDIQQMFKQMKSSYESFRTKITHILEEGESVAVRYSFFASTIERPTKEEAVGHFITIWEIKDGLLYKGFQISQQGDSSYENIISFEIE